VLPSVVRSTYSSALSLSSGTFSRDNSMKSNYSYQPLQIDISLSGTYQFSSESSMDTYGYLYNDTFDPASPSKNRMSSDDDGCGNRQFWLQAHLQRNITYILVVTTYNQNTLGSFSMLALGGASVTITHRRKCHCHRLVTR
jgi:hypothetical protein